MFAGLAALTGVFAAWLHLGFSPALWTSDYGRLLLIKLAILAAVAAIGAYNWRRVKPALDDAGGTKRIQRSATMELGVGVLVVIVTAILVATAPPTDVGGDPGRSTRIGSGEAIRASRGTFDREHRVRRAGSYARVGPLRSGRGRVLFTP